MSDAGKDQEPSMEEILASIRRIIAEDEAGRAKMAQAPHPRQSTDGPSRARGPAWKGSTDGPSGRVAPTPASNDVVLDLTNMVAADGSVVAIAPTSGTNSRTVPPASPPPAPPQFVPAASPEPQPAALGTLSRRAAPPPGPGPDLRTPPLPSAPPMQPVPPMQPIPPMQPVSTDSPSRNARISALPQPLPPNLSEDSPSRRVFKRRHQAGSAFAELAQTGFAAPPSAAPAFGKVPPAAVTTELEIHSPPSRPVANEARAAAGYPDAFHAPPHAPHAHPVGAPMAPAPALSEEQVRASIASAAEPMVRAWIEANLGTVLEQQLSTLVQARVDECVASSVGATVDQRIHQNVESNLSPYIEDRVGAHLDARLSPALDEKIGAAVKQQIAAAVNEQIAQTVTRQIAAAVKEHLHSQHEELRRLVDERVKGEIRGMLQRLAGS